MNKNTLIAILAFFGILVALVLIETCVICHLVVGSKEDPQPVIKTEYKTVFRDRPAPTSSRILPDRYFFIPVEKVLTITKNDTTYLQLPAEQKTYEDTLYTAWVSGYNPQLDSIRLRIPTTYVTTTVRERAPRWSFGVTVGPGLLVTPSGQLHGGVGLTLGVQYRF